MALFIKITITDFEHASRDKREISVVKDLGHDVEVIAKSKDGVNKVGEQDGFKVHYLSTRILGNSKYIIKLNRFFSIFYWAYYVRKLNATCISGHNLEAAVIGWLSNIFKSNKAALVYDPHEYTLKTKEKSKPGRLYGVIIATLEKSIIKRSEFTITVNRSIAEAMKNDYRLNETPLIVRNIANYWNINSQTNKQKRKAIFDALKIPYESFLVMYHGAVMKGRGIESLIESVNISGKGIGVVILGYGEQKYKEELNQLAISLDIPIYFHDAVPVGELWEYIGAVDVGVSLATNSCVNHYFMLPNKIFENIQSMTPIIASEFPEIKNIHHVHLWRYSDTCIMLDAHVNVDKDLTAGEFEKVTQQIGKELKDKLGINHINFQAECERGRNDDMIAPGYKREN